MFHSEMTSLYLGKVDVGVSAGSLVTKYGGLSNCERSIFVRSTVEAGTLSSTTGAAIGWQAPITSDQISNLLKDCFRSMRRIFAWAYWIYWDFCLIFL